MFTPLLCAHCQTGTTKRPGKLYCSRRCYWDSRIGKPSTMPPDVRARVASLGGKSQTGKRHPSKRVARLQAKIAAGLARSKKGCRHCDREFTPTAPNQRYCSGSCWRSAQRVKKPIARRFIIAKADYDRLLAIQLGVCVVCGNGNIKNYGKISRLAVDHCHSTDRVRGLLCNHCNMGIGCLKDDPALLRKAAAYLEAADTGIKGEYSTDSRRFI